MRFIVFAGSLLAVVAAVLLLVADSVGPCEGMEEAAAEYHYDFSCDEEILAQGHVSFANELGSWWFEVEHRGYESVDDVGQHAQEEQNDSAREVYGSFVVAHVDTDYEDCGPGTGIGVFEKATAEAAVGWFEGTERVNRVFGCDVYPQVDRVECSVGPVRPPRHPDDDDDPPEYETNCGLVLTAGALPEQ